MGKFTQFYNKSFEFIAGSLYFLSIVCKDVYNLLNSIEDQRKFVQIAIEPINICNANCVFCTYQYKKDKSRKEIDLHLVKKLIDSFCATGGGNVSLTPLNGEPLLSSNLEHIVAMCRSREEIKKIRMSTNGILLTPKRFLSLRDAGVSEIIISMTYPDEKEYENLYRSKQFHRLMNNLNELILLDRRNVEIVLNIKTNNKRLFWKGHPLFKRAKLAGFQMYRNFYLDDWSGKVSNKLKELGLLRRPLRGRYLPCTVLYRGPYALASGRITACGCRDIEGHKELSNEIIFHPFHESGDLHKIYYETIESLRRRFVHGSPPSICSICRLYSPEFRFASTRDRLSQVYADIKAFVGFIRRLRT